MDLRGKLLLGAGIVLAVVAGLATYIVLTRARELAPNSAVVVAAVDIPERTVISASNVDALLRVEQIPSSQVPDGALTDLKNAIGRASAAPIAAREVVVAAKLVETASSGAGPSASALLPRDSVAMAIPVNSLMSVAGAVRPDDRVDIIGTIFVSQSQAQPAPVTQYLMQDVRVLSIGQWGDPQAASSGQYSMVTLILDRQQAALLQHLLQTDAHLTMVLRRIDDQQQVATDAVNAEYVARRFGLAGGPVPAPPPTAAPR